MNKEKFRDKKRILFCNDCESEVKSIPQTGDFKRWVCNCHKEVEMYSYAGALGFFGEFSLYKSVINEMKSKNWVVK